MTTTKETDQDALIAALLLPALGKAPPLVCHSSRRDVSFLRLFSRCCESARLMHSFQHAGT